MSDNDPLMENETTEILGDVAEAGVIRSIRNDVVIVKGVVKRRTASTYQLASCGHVIYNASTLGGRCGEKDCNDIACKACTRTCNRCLKTICPKHSKMFNGLAYCSWCRWMVMLGFSQSQQTTYWAEGE